MTNLNRPKVIAIYGPTISEKTGLAVNIAKYVWGKYKIEPELISADSKKVYQELTVGPAALFPQYGGKSTIHMYRFIESLEVKFTLFDYKQSVDQIIKEIHSRGHLPIIFGGGAVWISSVLENWHVPKTWTRGQDYKASFGKGAPNYDYIILIPDVNKHTLFHKIDAYTKRSIKLGIFKELILLAKKYGINPNGPPTGNVLFESMEYRQFLKYCQTTGKKLEQLNSTDIENVRKNSVEDLKDFARRQFRWIPKMAGEKHFVKSWKEARIFVDHFLS